MLSENVLICSGVGHFLRQLWFATQTCLARLILNTIRSYLDLSFKLATSQLLVASYALLTHQIQEALLFKKKCQ